ncbi:hypothetical protein G9A89_010829 [Geosiphon pyriformis]|nr:hypothetical protein G9A89_010829 [Geosiphon pyriformis]
MPKISGVDLKLDTLRVIFETASENELRDVLQEAKGNSELAANIFLMKHKSIRMLNPLKRLKQTESHGNSIGCEPKIKRPKLEITGQVDESLKFSTTDAFDSLQSESNFTLSLADALKWPTSTSIVSQVAKKSNKLPLMLYRPEDVLLHTPCQLIPNILPKNLAHSLLLVMLKESETWERNQWWLFDREVSSPHSSCFYITEHAKASYGGEYYYNGSKAKDTRLFLPEMDEARKVITDKVNGLRKNRIRYSIPKFLCGPLKKFFEIFISMFSFHRHPFEGRGDWEPNVAAANCYSSSKESVGWHSDKLTYLGPRPIIGSLSLGATRQFRIRRVVPSNSHPDAASRIISISLPHNSLLIMWCMQEEWKHEVCPQQASTLNLLKCFFSVIDPHNVAGPKRINLTFRQFREEYSTSWTPICHCGIPSVLRPVMKKEATFGRYFYMCEAGSANQGKNCGFFEWLNVQEREKA